MNGAEPEAQPTAPPGGWPASFDPSRDVMLTPRRLRGLVHPIRVRLLFLLENDGPATASQLGRRIGQSSGVTSYHLRVLADLGFVEDDPEHGNGRDRWWTFGENAIELTHDEARALAVEVTALIQRYRRESGQSSQRDGAVRATFQFQLLPDEDLS
jgi:DNA-binding transcriptional ArsR family regulator